MIGRRCTHSNVFSRPVLIARNLSFKPNLESLSSKILRWLIKRGEDPPLPIPNREVKLTSADGTAPPGGRVGSCRFSKSPTEKSAGLFLFIVRIDREISRTLYFCIARAVSVHTAAPACLIVFGKSPLRGPVPLFEESPAMPLYRCMPLPSVFAFVPIERAPANFLPFNALRKLLASYFVQAKVVND